MGLHLMPYGPSPDDLAQVSVGTLELLGQKAIVRRDDQLDIPDDDIGSHTIWPQADDADLEDAVDAAKDARIVIMNPPFTSRWKMGEKFPKPIQEKLRRRVDQMEGVLIRTDSDMVGFTNKTSVRPMFSALACKCVRDDDGVVSMILPTIGLCIASGQRERQVLAERFQIHTILTCHLPGQNNLSQRTNINESIVLLRRHSGPKLSTRIINLDRLPTEEAEVEDMHRSILRCSSGQIDNGWGVVSYASVDRIVAGDWSAAIWRSPELAEASNHFSDDQNLVNMETLDLLPTAPKPYLYRSYRRTGYHGTRSFPVLASKGEDGQTRIESQPDEYWTSKTPVQQGPGILKQAGCLLVTMGQDPSTARLTAVASDRKYVGAGWMPVSNLTSKKAKAIAVFINSTPGRLQLMRNPGRKLTFPEYNPAAYANIRIPNINDERIRSTLADCWQRTKDMVVPQFRDGECEVRRLWDEAVAEAMGWDPEELARLRNLLHNEPHVRGLGYNQYADEPEE